MTTPTSILLNDDVAIKLLSYTNSTHLEFSGFGFCNIQGEQIVVYDFVLLHVGSFGYTQIEPELVLKLMDRPDASCMKVWIHKHPMGSGVPGPNNWSGRDEMTCIEEPMGGVPMMVKWSAAVVITPHGWVGRVDNHLSHRTIHLPVLPEVKPFHTEIAELSSRGGDQEETYAHREGDQETTFTSVGSYRLPFPRGVVDVDTEFLEPSDPDVLAVSETFTKEDLDMINWTRGDLLSWIEDDLALYEGDPEYFVTHECAHLREFLGAFV